MRKNASVDGDGAHVEPFKRTQSPNPAHLTDRLFVGLGLLLLMLTALGCGIFRPCGLAAYVALVCLCLGVTLLIGPLSYARFHDAKYTATGGVVVFSIVFGVLYNIPQIDSLISRCDPQPPTAELVLYNEPDCNRHLVSIHGGTEVNKIDPTLRLRPERVLGRVYTQPVAGTIKLYTCIGDDIWNTSTASDCEGVGEPIPQGYIYPPATSGPANTDGTVELNSCKRKVESSPGRPSNCKNPDDYYAAIVCPRDEVKDLGRILEK